MALNLQVDTALGTTAQTVKDQNGNSSLLSLSKSKIGIGTTNPTQKLTIGSGNLLLPISNAGVDGNLYLGGTTDTGQVGMRLFGGTRDQSGFIDVRASTPTGGLIFRVDTSAGGTERLRINASGNVGIGTSNPQGKLDVNGNIFLAGSNVNAAFSLSPSDASPNAGYIRFGDNTGWKLHFGRSRESSILNGTPLNTGTTGVLMTIQDNGHVGIGTIQPEEALHVVGNIVTTGDIRLVNADCAEDFDISETEQIEPGTVMVLGEDGKLHQSQTAYDQRVVGVVSGAGNYKPGIVLDKQADSHHRLPIALMGKVYCKVDADCGAIKVGDLLTTSPLPGHAMKADEPLEAFGAVIGKALHSLGEGQGLLPILISLQ
jgi:hypothetical protein